MLTVHGREKQAKCPLFLAGEAGLEPANIGIKIRCLNHLGDSPVLVKNPSRCGTNPTADDVLSFLLHSLTTLQEGFTIPVWHLIRSGAEEKPLNLNPSYGPTQREKAFVWLV